MDMIIWLKIFTTFVVFHKVKMKRLVVNTTCLELARPSNQQLRLSCSNPSDYHCLLDDTFTKEFEVCREWKWIPGGKCAYFNTYEAGNIDGRACINSGNWLCPNMQYVSTETTKYPTCHMKKNMAAVTTSSFQVASELPSDTNPSTSSPFHETIGITNDRKWVITSVSLSIGVIILLLSIIVGYFRYRRGKEEKSAKSMQGSRFDPTICKEEESFVVYFESAQVPQTNEKDEKLCTELINLLAVDGLKLSQKVLAAVISRATGKSIAELVADKTVRNKVKGICNIFPTNSLEHEEPIQVLHALFQIYLEEKYHPKSGLTNQVSETDTGIGDDVVRLFNIQNLVPETKNCGTAYVESYIRQLDDLIGALSRLDPDAEFKDENKALANKLDAIKNRSLTKTIIKINRRNITCN